MAVPRDEGGLRLQTLLIIATLLIGFTIEVVGYAVDPDGGKRFVGFAAIYGWLMAFALMSRIIPGKRRSLLVAGAAPLFLLALVSIALSFPIYLLPAGVLLLAIASVKDSTRSP